MECRVVEVFMVRRSGTKARSRTRNKVEMITEGLVPAKPSHSQHLTVPQCPLLPGQRRRRIGQ